MPHEEVTRYLESKYGVSLNDVQWGLTTRDLRRVLRESRKARWRESTRALLSNILPTRTAILLKDEKGRVKYIVRRGRLAATTGITTLGLALSVKHPVITPLLAMLSLLYLASAGKAGSVHELAHVVQYKRLLEAFREEKDPTKRLKRYLQETGKMTEAHVVMEEVFYPSLSSKMMRLFYPFFLPHIFSRALFLKRVERLTGTIRPEKLHALEQYYKNHPEEHFTRLLAKRLFKRARGDSNPRLSA